MADIRPDSEQTVLLLERVRAGDTAAIEELLAAYRPELKRFVIQRLDQQLQARLDASDVVQEALAEVTRRLREFLNRAPMPFHLWLRRTALQQLTMLRRKHLGAARRTVHREAELPEQSSVQIAEQLLAREPSISHALRQQELVRRVHTALASLSERDREVVHFRWIDGMSYAEIGCVLDIDEAAARQRHGRALARLVLALNAPPPADSSEESP